MPAHAGRRRLVTLTTDIGWAYAAQLKAVLLHRVPAERIVDLAHDLPPHAVREAAFLLRAMAERYPAGSVHLCVVDPGVGGRRAPLAVRCADGSFLVGPDNGVLALLAERLGVRRTVRLDPSRVALPDRTGTVFDGRDLFAPAAARLATGERIEALGEPTTLTRLSLPEPRERGRQARGEVLYVDRFGNLITNFPQETFARLPPRVAVRVGRRAPQSLPRARSYEELGAGGAGVLLSSFGLLEVSVAHGSAAKRWNARPGTSVALGPLADPLRTARRRPGAHNGK